MAVTTFKYLALGDSYTIGEGVDPADSFPFQLLRMMNKTGRNSHLNEKDIPVFDDANNYLSKAKHFPGPDTVEQPTTTEPMSGTATVEVPTGAKHIVGPVSGKFPTAAEHISGNATTDIGMTSGSDYAGRADTMHAHLNQAQMPGINQDQQTGHFEEPVIIAKTGWTTSELLTAINAANVKDKFDIVTLLIGVNNQYQGLALDDYGFEFGQLSSLALAFAGNKPSRVFVLSIPDWSATPFAVDRDRETISFTIDRFNELNKEISLSYGFHYIDITAGSRHVINDTSLVTKDQLHPSPIEYRKWAEQLFAAISKHSFFKEFAYSSHGKSSL